MIDRLRSASAGAVDSTADGASEVWWAADCGRQLVIKAKMSIDVIRIWHITKDDRADQSHEKPLVSRSQRYRVTGFCPTYCYLPTPRFR